MNKLISCFLAAVMIFANNSFIFSADKKDVADPVLKEIISELSTTMPRFINKYGTNVFVSDEQITRASLIQALYEYNKNRASSVSPAVSSNIGFVSKDDFNLLKNKVSALEKKSVGSGSSASSSVSSNMDIIQVMNDLEPNMPMLLDNSLQNSKVFKDLEKKVNSKVAIAGGSAGSGVSSAQLDSIKTDITNLSQKYDSLSASLASGKDSKMTSSQVSANISVLQKEIASINVKLAGLQDTIKNSSSQEQFKSSDLDNLKQEMASLKTKVASIDSTALASSKNSKTNVSQQEIAKLNEEIASLKTKMANIDTTVLASSKNNKATLSASQQQEIKNLNDEVESLKKSVVQAQKSYVDVAKRVNSLEDRPIVSSNSGSASNSQIGYLESKINSIKKTMDSIPTNEEVQSQISKSNSKTTTDIKKIENRLNELEKNKSSYKGSSGSDSSGSSAGTITKISLGLTLVAALFIAR